MGEETDHLDLDLETEIAQAAESEFQRLIKKLKEEEKKALGDSQPQ